MKGRVMARPVPPPRRARGLQGVSVAILALVGVGLIGVSGVLRSGASATPGSSSIAGLPTNPSSATLSGPTPSTRPQTREPSRIPSDEPTALPTMRNKPSTQPMVTPGSGGAPTSPAQFDLERQRVEMGFPMRPDTRYHYRDNFLDPRAGPPDEYNHARMGTDGTAHRLHDGIDIYAAQGEPLIAPFSGLVVDPGARWQPWERARYGETVVIESDEPTSAGYLALFAHMANVWIEPGTHVTRGQVVGTVGRSGNAETEGVRPQLHFELRAPFALDWSPLGEDRAVDAFNPYPSLVAADPKRT